MAVVGRQSHLTLCKGVPIVKIRMDCMNKETMMTDYFEKLKYVLQGIKLMNSLSQAYNVNKTGILLDHRLVWDKEKSEEGI